MSKVPSYMFNEQHYKKILKGRGHCPPPPPPPPLDPPLLLMKSNHFESNIGSKSGSYAFFDGEFDSVECIPQKFIKNKSLFSSSQCKITIIYDASVKENVSDYQANEDGYSDIANVSFWIKDLQFSVIVVDYFNNYYV